MNRTRIVIAGAAPDAEPTYLILDELGSVVGSGILQVQEPSALTPMRTVLVIPGADVLVRWAPIKAASEAQARGAALAQLEDQMTSAAGVHVALGPQEADGQRLVVALSGARMQAWLDHAALHGVSPVLVIPDCLALPEPPSDPLDNPEGPPVIITAEFGPLIAVRGQRLAFTGEPDLVTTIVGARPATALAGPALERAMANMAASPAINLLQGAFDPDRREPLGRRDLRRAAILAAVLLVSPLILWAAQAGADHVRARQAEARAEAKVAALLAEGETITDPAVQAQARLDALALVAGGGASGLAAQLFAAVEPMDQVQVESLIIMPDGAARAALSHAAYADGESLAQALQAAGLTVRVEGSREESGRVISDVILGARP
ncbi:MAG: type II secretion system protein GspL [Phenylobacterium sp.]|uniref:type II secretion system protein GspL n=1 Tax=Phenylobacterium sp. TaxID=1871053 RepID=UPI00271C8E61|nr:type II secretion system protein GspL [Phenylobacterium sp.]MDO8900112.1 type II secretion system protein GspL [Phenylobacterium sp.]